MLRRKHHLCVWRNGGHYLEYVSRDEMSLVEQIHKGNRHFYPTHRYYFRCTRCGFKYSAVALNAAEIEAVNRWANSVYERARRQDADRR